MKRDIRKGIKGGFLYKRFAYNQSEGFIALMKFLKDENLFYKFCEEFNFTNSKIEEEMEYPGQIKVNIIRESRHSDVAK